MLTGENGILTNATNANSTNVYYGAEEQIKLAYMSVRSKIITETVANASYNATSTSNPDNVTALANIVRKDLNIPEGSEVENTEGYKVVTDVSNATSPKIKITYTNAKISAGTIEAGKPSENGKVEYDIKLQPQNAILKEYKPLKGISFGNKTEKTIDVGEDFTIGTESFRVLKTDKSTQIIAVPHYNITLVTPENNNGAYPEQSTSTGTTKFTNNIEDKYWTTEQDSIDNIDWTNDKCLLKPYVQAYSAKLDVATGCTRRVSARLGKLSEFQDSAIVLLNDSILTKKQVKNPGQTGNFWLCSGHPGNANIVYTVGSNGGIDGSTRYYNYNSGVRPVVVIDI